MLVLAVGAHPDDVELGCGATLAKHALSGDSVYILTMGDGVAARGGPPEECELLCSALRKESVASANVLGAAVWQHFKHPDNRMDTVARLDLIKNIEHACMYLNPSIIYTHHSGDRNIDHRIVYDAVCTATRPLPGSTVRRVLSYEVQSSTEWGQTFEPNVYVDVSGEPMMRKVEALKQYASEMREFPHPRSLGAIVALSQLRGSHAGVQAAEAFRLVREVA